MNSIIPKIFRQNILKFYLIFFLHAVLIKAQIWHDHSFPPDKNFYSISFSDSLTGWVVGDSGLVIKTTNGGKSWEKFNSVPFEDQMVKIQSVDEQNIIILSGISSRGSSFIISNDGGENWEVKPFLFLDSYLTDFYFLSPDTGYVVGLAGKMYKTFNGMESWEEIIDPNNFFPNRKVYFLNADTGFVTGGRIDLAGFIKKTNDGGNSWENKLSTVEPINNLYFINEDTVFAVGGDPEYGGWIYLSIDKGETWRLQNVPAGVITLASVNYANKNSGWAGGAGSILNSTDFGETWKQVREDPVFISSIETINGRDFWFAGSSGFLFMYEDTTGSFDTTLTNIETGKVKEDNNRLKVYPNPFNGTSSISYSVSEARHIKIYIYNFLGEKIKTIFSGFREEGEYKINFSLNEFSSGNYLIISLFNNDLKIQKITLLK